MVKLTKIINSTPPSGFRWSIVGGGKTHRSGTAETQAQANAAADAAVKELEDANKDRDK